jgi:hypothetical protein
MTERKPPGTPTGSWVERQIRAAQERGAFDELPGRGRPIRDIDRPWDESHWLRAFVQREGLSASVLLPPALALAKEREELPGLLVRERSEERVRALVTDFNDRVRQARLTHLGGPPLTVRTCDVEQAVTDWRTAREQRAPRPAPVGPPERPRRWWHRR